MRTIPAALATHLAGNVVTLALCLKIVRPDGSILGLTTFDRDLTFGGQLYQVIDGIAATSLRASQGTGIDNLEVSGILQSSLIADVDLLAGRYDGASVEFFLVNWAQVPLTDRAILAFGNLGEFTFSEGQYRTEVRSLSQRLSQNIVELISSTCRVRQLGDSRCKLVVPAQTITAITQAAQAQVTTATPHGLAVGQGLLFTLVGGMTQINGLLSTIQSVPTSTTFTVAIDSTGFSAFTSGGQIGFQWARTVASVVSATQLTFSGETINASGYYNSGRVIMTSGANVGFSKEIKSQTTAASVATVLLSEPFPFAINVGDTALLEAGCDRALATCRDRFANTVNNRSEPHVPGNDVIQTRGRR